MLDAPVSGGVLAAEAGTLTFMVRDFQPEKTRKYFLCKNSVTYSPNLFVVFFL